MGLTWEDPPHLPFNTNGQSGHWKQVAYELRRKPGKWALISEDANMSLRTRIVQGSIVAFRPAGEYEATAKRLFKGSVRFKVWARYIGDEEA